METYQMQNRKPNLLDSLTGLTKNIVVMAETRLKLLALDLQETGLNFLSLLVLSGIILTCFGLALILTTLVIVVIFWDSHRLLALGGAAGFFAFAGLGLWLTVLAKFRNMPQIFGATREEFAKDRAWLTQDALRVANEN
jgi:uncharacterized membrane protein YqjE